MMNTKKSTQFASFRFYMLTLLKVLLPTTMICYFSSLRSFHEKGMWLCLLVLATGDKCDKWHVTGEGWHMVHDMWHVTCDIWNVTCHNTLLCFVNLGKRRRKVLLLFYVHVKRFIVSIKMACTQDLRVWHNLGKAPYVDNYRNHLW